MPLRTPGIDLFITDWDGTIWDSFEWIHRGWDAVFGVLAPNVQPPPEEIHRSTITHDPCRFGYENGIPASISKKEIMAVWSDWAKKNPLSGALIPGTPELLRGLQRMGVITAIVSASPESRASFEARLILEGIHDFFHNIELNAQPSKTDAINATLEKFGVRPGKAIYCDDTDHGIMNAQETGVWTIGMVSPQAHHSAWRIEDAKPDFLASSLYEVMEIVKSIGQ